MLLVDFLPKKPPLVFSLTFLKENLGGRDTNTQIFRTFEKFSLFFGITTCQVFLSWQILEGRNHTALWGEGFFCTVGPIFLSAGGFFFPGRDSYLQFDYFLFFSGFSGGNGSQRKSFSSLALSRPGNKSLCFDWGNPGKTMPKNKNLGEFLFDPFLKQLGGGANGDKRIPKGVYFH